MNAIGKNIKELRKEKGLSQEKLAKMCGFSNTTLCSYENGRKTPGLVTIANIAKSLGVSIERLYYGDENIAFISSEPDEGRKIVNAVYFLWEAGVINYYEDLYHSPGYTGSDPQKKGPVGFLNIEKYFYQLRRLIMSLNEFKAKKTTYPDPEAYLKMLFSSVAAEINENNTVVPGTRKK